MNPIIDLLVQALDYQGTAEYVPARAAAHDALQQYDPETALTFLTPALDHTDPMLRREAVYALRLLQTARATEVLCTLLGDSDYLIRADAITALSQRDVPDLVPTLIKLLEDPEEFVRASAIAALGTCNDIRAIPHLISMLRPGTYPISTWAATALGRLYRDRAIDDLLLHLHDREPTIRAGIAMVLGQLSRSTTLSPLLGCLHDLDPRVRSEAIAALGQLRDARAADALIEALKDADPGVRNRAGWALSALNEPHAFESLLQALDDPVDNDGASAALATVGEPAFLGLLRLLDATNSNTRRQAIRTLAGYFSTHPAWANPTITAHAWQRLAELLQTADEPTQEHILSLFSFIRDRRIVLPVLEKLNDSNPRIRWHAVLTLIQLGDPNALPALEHMSVADDGIIEVLDHGGTEQLALRDEAKRAICQIRERQ